MKLTAKAPENRRLEDEIRFLGEQKAYFQGLCHVSFREGHYIRWWSSQSSQVFLPRICNSHVVVSISTYQHLQRGAKWFLKGVRFTIPSGLIGTRFEGDGVSAKPFVHLPPHFISWHCPKSPLGPEDSSNEGLRQNRQQAVVPVLPFRTSHRETLWWLFCLPICGVFRSYPCAPWDISPNLSWIYGKCR